MSRRFSHINISVLKLCLYSMSFIMIIFLETLTSVIMRRFHIPGTFRDTHVQICSSHLNIILLKPRYFSRKIDKIIFLQSLAILSHQSRLHIFGTLRGIEVQMSYHSHIIIINVFKTLATVNENR